MLINSCAIEISVRSFLFVTGIQEHFYTHFRVAAFCPTTKTITSLLFSQMAWPSVKWPALQSNGLAFSQMACPSVKWPGLQSNGLPFSQMAWPSVKWPGLQSTGLQWNSLSCLFVGQFCTYEATDTLTHYCLD